MHGHVSCNVLQMCESNMREKMVMDEEKWNMSHWQDEEWAIPLGLDCIIMKKMMWAMVGHLSALLSLSVLRHSLQLERIWPGKNRH